MLFLIKNVSVSFAFTIQREEETGSRLLFLLCISETLLAMQAGLSSSQRLVSAMHVHTHKNSPQGGKCIYHTEYVIVIQHEDASKPLFQNTLLFKASENSGAYWGLEHLWFNKFSEYHNLRSFFSILVIFHLRTLPGLTIMLMQKIKKFCLLVHCSIFPVPGHLTFLAYL